jgi:hypothetical protein
MYARWSTAKWNELETKEQKRRGVAVPSEGEADPQQASLPRGERDGWHKHWRRGLFGALQSWAAGSRGAIVYMLAACATHFNVVREVRLRGSRACLACLASCMHALHVWYASSACLACLVCAHVCACAQTSVRFVCVLCPLAARRGTQPHAPARRGTEVQAVQVHNGAACIPRAADAQGVRLGGAEPRVPHRARAAVTSP